uniref:CDP-diacylglycerol--inositol 3-phosphatidyltransferase n=1 Tax=Nothobranchius rachovii TaxID=451742 RepID=A0A1A8S3N0_9TELE
MRLRSGGGRRVVLFWPNIVGYIRISLVFAAWAAHQSPAAFVPLYTLASILDGVDGWLARKLGQTSRFGAWLDVLVDNLSRSMLWSLLFQWGWLVSTLEWCVFVCNHSTRGPDWKSSFSSSPRLIRAIMANGLWTPLGVWVVSGLHGLPLWLYLHQNDLLSDWLDLQPWVQSVGTVVLAAGRVMALSAEMWCIWTHIQYLTSDETEDQKLKT